jgi:membrane associated rhomboid family serine protease
VAWVRGLGQGYVLTPEGEAALAGGPGLIRTREAGLPPPPAHPNPRLPEEVERRLGPDQRAPLAVPLLLIANVLWFFVGIAAVVRGGYPLGRYLSDGHPYLLHRLGAVTGGDLMAGEWWRLLAACFVHIGLLHLLVNLFALAMMGPLVELLWGRWRFLVIYLVSGLAGSCLAMANRPDALLAGASGAIWGLLASLVAWLTLHRQHLQPEVAADWTRRLWVVLLLNVGVSLLPDISWEAHLGGGLAGFFAAWLLNAFRPGDRLRNLSVLALLALLPVVCVGGLIAVMKWGEPWEPVRQRAAANATRQTVEAAREVFLREVIPLLTGLSPDSVRPFEQQVGLLAIRPGERRNPEAVAATRARLAELKANAETVVRQLPPEPVGLESFDRHRARVRAFAAARVNQFAVSQALLDAAAPPDQAQWAAWGDARRAADELWEALGKR